MTKRTVNKPCPKCRLALSLLCAALASAAGAADEAAPYPVAGLTPWQRPAGAPVIQVHSLSTEAAEQALQGVSKPVPASVTAFMKDQGAWFNPFTRPGMTGPYDIRGWHKPKAEKP